ncbi:MAG: hypothetical protein U0821_08905 [Chloroflexota bacterium]
MAEVAQETIHQDETPLAFSEFLESVPPGAVIPISDLTKARYYMGSLKPTGYQIATPELQLHCSDAACNGIRFFRPSTGSYPDIPDKFFHFFYLTYICSNCQRVMKHFSLAAQRNIDAESGSCMKFGELPPYGPPTPPRLFALIGPDRELFLRGRRCENQALGIGAFVYYRRVVEGQKNRILNEIIKVARKIGAAPEQIKTLEDAITETQFSKALESVKDALPQSLLVNGHNPLTLLHSALSHGLHLLSDQDCLTLARSIRIVLAELSERLADALKDEAELNKAVARLLERKDG